MREVQLGCLLIHPYRKGMLMETHHRLVPSEPLLLPSRGLSQHGVTFSRVQHLLTEEFVCS